MSAERESLTAARSDDPIGVLALHSPSDVVQGDEGTAYCGACEREARTTRLHLVPLSLAQANEHVAAWHRHNRPTVGHKFSVGAADQDGVLRAVAIVGRPVARKQDDGQTLEVNRVASDGTVNANSMLYGACARAAFALGYTRLITYTQTDESGASLRAANFRLIAERPPNNGWSMPSRPRADIGSAGVARQLWEIAA